MKEAFQILAELGDDPESIDREARRHDPLYEGLIRRAGVLPGSSVLELGIGTAVVAVKLAHRIGPMGKMVGIDVNQRMLKVAKEKKHRLGLPNLDFFEMNMEELQFADSSFDHVISNFGVCCAFYHDKTLREAYRVLRPGGKLTYNHEGPNETQLSKVYGETFSKYKTKKPSETLKKKREANSLQSDMWSKYRDSSTVLSLMREIGYKKPEASITPFRLVFPTRKEYIDYNLVGSLEYSEMTRDKREQFRKECSAKLKGFLSDEGLVDNGEVAYYTGYK